VLKDLCGGVGDDDPDAQSVKMILPFVRPEGGNVVADRTFRVL
jgi:hypothetical protein